MTNTEGQGFSRIAGICTSTIFGLLGAIKTIENLSDKKTLDIYVSPWTASLVCLSGIGGAISGQWLMDSEGGEIGLTVAALVSFLFLGLGGPVILSWRKPRRVTRLEFID